MAPISRQAKAKFPSCPRYPRYLTFRRGELEDRYRGLLKLPPGAPLPSSSPKSGGRNRTALVKSHRITVTYPDGQSGSCAYERGGPVWHVFKYRYNDGTLLPVQHVTHRLEGGTTAIEAKGQELAAAAYRAAVDRERKEYFQRAAEQPHSGRPKRPDRYRMSPARAREQAGRYSVCLRLGNGGLIPIGTSFEPTWDGLLAANDAWRADTAARDTHGQGALTPLVVGCCNRLDRRWEQPRFNPLYREQGQERFDGPSQERGEYDGR